MDISSIALQGLDQASAQADAAASQIANSGTSSPDGANLDVVNLSAEMVALMSAQNAYQVNLVTLNTADQMQAALLDVKA